MMNKNFFLILCTIFTVNAMEVEKADKILYLADLPTDALNHIASYLVFNDRESDDEFIERTWKYGAISQEHADLLEQHEEQNNSEFAAIKRQYPTMHFLNGRPRAYSADCSKIMGLEMSKKDPKVTIFDIQSKTKKENAKLSELSKENIDAIRHIALSRTGSYYATLCIFKSYEEGRGEVMLISLTTYLFIKNVLSEQEQKFLIPGQYRDFISIAFNKQGTKVIVHAKENGLWVGPVPEKDKPVNFHIISLATPEEHEEKSKVTLEGYFRSIGCCQSLH